MSCMPRFLALHDQAVSRILSAVVSNETQLVPYQSSLLIDLALLHVSVLETCYAGAYHVPCHTVAAVINSANQVEEIVFGSSPNGSRVETKEVERDRS
jgi:hypothetical protein